MAIRLYPASPSRVGFFWAAALAHLRMADWLAPELEGRDLDVVGVVSSLPALSERACASSSRSSPCPAARACRKSCCSPGIARRGRRRMPRCSTQAVHPGERWLFTVRLRRPHGNVNPYGFDYEAWLLERGIGATGYVAQRGERRQLGSRNAHFGPDRKSARGGARSLPVASSARRRPRASSPRSRSATSARSRAEEWRLFNRTGVTHLMSISGLHVTLVSGLAAWLVAFVWRRVPAARAAPAGAQGGGARRHRRRARLHAARRLRRARAAHVLDGDRGRARAVVRAHRLAVAHAGARAGGDRGCRPVGAARRPACGSRSARWR